MIKVKVIRVPIGFNFNRECGFLVLTFLGLEFGINWSSDYGSLSFELGTIYRGICFEPPRRFWLYRQNWLDFCNMWRLENPQSQTQEGNDG